MATVRLSEAALERHADALIALPNVVMLGTAVAEDAVAVYVSEMQPESDLLPEERIPEFLVVDDQTVPVRVMEIGELGLESESVDE